VKNFATSLTLKFTKSFTNLVKLAKSQFAHHGTFLVVHFDNPSPRQKARATMKTRLVWIAVLLCAAAAAATSRKLEDDNDDDVQGDLLCTIFIEVSGIQYVGLVATIVLFPVFVC